MKLQYLKTNFKKAIRILKGERIARSIVFAKRPNMLAAKLADIDFVIELMVEMKDELKPHLELDMEQAPLLDDVPTGDYQMSRKVGR